MYVHVWARSLCFWSERAMENNFARMAVRSSFMYNLTSLSSLYTFRFLRILRTRSRSALLTNLTIIGFGSLRGAFRRVGRRWLTLISLSSSGGSTLRISLAMLTTACVVSSWVLETPLMRRLCLRPCCSRASLASLRCCTSDCRAAIWASRSANAVRRVVTSVQRDETESTRSLLAVLMILDSF